MDQLIDTPKISAFAVKVAGRLRGKLAEDHIAHKEVYLAQGWSRTTGYRKINGLYPLDADELGVMWEAFGISPIYLFTGVEDERPFPGRTRDHVSGRSSVQSRQGARTQLHLVTNND